MLLIVLDGWLGLCYLEEVILENLALEVGCVNSILLGASSNCSGADCVMDLMYNKLPSRMLANTALDVPLHPHLEVMLNDIELFLIMYPTPVIIISQQMY